MKRLPTDLKLNDARQNKNEFFASLTAFEVELLDAAASGFVFACTVGLSKTDKVFLERKGERKIVADGQKTVDRLVQMGWLWFAGDVTNGNSPTGSGHFWHTPTAERVWRELGRR